MKVGSVRELTYDPAIKTTRGFLDTSPDNKNPNTNIFSSAELLNSFTASHSDPPRKFRAIHVSNYMSKSF